MHNKNVPVPYNTYFYLTRTDLTGDKPTYLLHVLLWMPENYTYHNEVERKPPAGEPAPPECVDPYGIVLIDSIPDEPDLDKFHMIAVSVDIGTPLPEKKVLQVFYSVKNETQNNIKISKKPKGKVGYIHADNGGASPEPPAVLI